MAGYWKKVFAGAWQKTWMPLGWDRKKIAVVLVAVFAVVGTGIHFGLAAMIASAITDIWIVMPIALAAIVLFLWGVMETQAELYADLAQGSDASIVKLQTKIRALTANYADKKPNYAAVRRQHHYAIGAASRLWIDRDPNIKGTPDSQSWYDTFVSAIKKGELNFQPRWPRDNSLIRHERERPDFNTMVSRDEFKRYAASIGEDPPFLRDE